ncbi:MAG: hypothetical protein ACFFCQ_09870 [Promethearchaeota archaeon]
MPISKKKTFQNVIDEAVNQEIISIELAGVFHYLRRSIRKILVHRQDMASHMIVGIEKDPESDTGFMLSDERLEKLAPLQRVSKESLFVSKEVFAREAIKSCFNFFRDVFPLVEIGVIQFKNKFCFQLLLFFCLTNLIS